MYQRYSQWDDRCFAGPGAQEMGWRCSEEPTLGYGDLQYGANIAPPASNNTPAPPPQWQQDIDAFKTFLASQNPYFTQAADRLLGESQGVNPLFDQYRNAQLGLLESQRGQQVGAMQSALAQRGVTGSAAMNEINKLNQGFNQQGQVMSGQIGLQGLDMSNQALQNSLAARSAGITQAGFPAGLDIAALAAKNAGKGGDSGGGGAFGTVICSMCRFRGDITDAMFQADREYVRRKVSLTLYIGYMFWAPKLVALSFRFPWAYRFFTKPLGVHWARYAAHEVGLSPVGDRLGAMLHAVGAPFTFLIGKIIRESRRWRTFSLRTYLQS